MLASVDTTVRELYRLFKKALKDKVFLVPNARNLQLPAPMPITSA